MLGEVNGDQCGTFLTGVNQEERSNERLVLEDANRSGELGPPWPSSPLQLANGSVSPTSPMELSNDGDKSVTPTSPLFQIANAEYAPPQGRAEYLSLIKEASASCVRLAREDNPLPEMHRVLDKARAKLKKENERLDAYIEDVSRLQDGLTTSAKPVPPLRESNKSGEKQQTISSQATLRPVRSQGHLGHGHRPQGGYKHDTRDVVQRSRSQETLTRLDAAGEALASFLHHQLPIAARDGCQEQRTLDMRRPPSAARMSSSGSRPVSAARSSSQQPTGASGSRPASAARSGSQQSVGASGSRPASAAHSCSDQAACSSRPPSAKLGHIGNSRPPSAKQGYLVSSRPPSAASSCPRSSRSQCDTSISHRTAVSAERPMRGPLSRSASLDARIPVDAAATIRPSELCDRGHGNLPRIPHHSSSGSRRGSQFMEKASATQLPQENFMEMPLLSRLASMSQMSRKSFQGHSSTLIRSASCHILKAPVF